MKISFQNRVGLLLLSIGEFFCRQGKRIISAERVRYWREAQKTLAEAEKNAVPFDFEGMQAEIGAEMEEWRKSQPNPLAGFDWNQPVCGSTGREAPLLPMNHPYLRPPKKSELGGDGGVESEDNRRRREMGRDD